MDATDFNKQYKVVTNDKRRIWESFKKQIRKN
jgi:hypothetical protein